MHNLLVIDAVDRKKFHYKCAANFVYTLYVDVVY